MPFLETERVFVHETSRRKGVAFLVLAERGLDSADDVPRLRDLLSRGSGAAPPMG